MAASVGKIASPAQGVGYFEHANPYRRDVTMGEDASRGRTRHAPADSATLNNSALAIVFHHGFCYLPEANLPFMMHRDRAPKAILAPS